MTNRSVKRIIVEYYTGEDDVFTNEGNTKDLVPKNHVIGDFIINYVPGKIIHIKSDIEAET